MKSFSIENNFLRAVFLSYGAILHELWVKTSDGKEINIIQGLLNREDYLTDEWARGAVIGRFAGRLENPIQINNQSIPIAHEGGVLLHSGSSGWHKKEWTLHTLDPTKLLCLGYTCPANSSGFPGEVNAQVTYKLEGPILKINYTAIPTATTHINLTNHAYFNLNPGQAIGHHILKIKADSYLELKETLVPTGKKLRVRGTPYDFLVAKQIKEVRLDDYFVLNPNQEDQAVLYSPETGIEMTVNTNQPGVVVFTPSHFEGICFETQKFSNTPNIPSFPSTEISAQTKYSHTTEFRFDLKNRD